MRAQTAKFSTVRLIMLYLGPWVHLCASDSSQYPFDCDCKQSWVQLLALSNQKGRPFWGKRWAFLQNNDHWWWQVPSHWQVPCAKPAKCAWSFSKAENSSQLPRDHCGMQGLPVISHTHDTKHSSPENFQCTWIQLLNKYKKYKNTSVFQASLTWCKEY